MPTECARPRALQRPRLVGTGSFPAFRVGWEMLCRGRAHSGASGFWSIVA
jgi:hypothetical protein